MRSFTITNASVVLPDRVLERGAVLIQEGLIAEVASSAAALRATPCTELDARGAYLISGLVDIHNDGLEMEVRPRPMSELPLDVAFPTYERRLASSGVTTEFHAISFMDQKKSNRTVSQASLRASYVAEQAQRVPGAVEHHVLHRIDVWSPQYLEDVFESVDRLSVGYLSLNDHTPGQGQFNDLDKYVEMQHAYASTRGYAPPNVNEIHNMIAERTAAADSLQSVYRRVAEAASLGRVILASHDDDSAGKVEAMWALGARVAEFPVTLEAARKARSLGMAIVVGAPNIVRGGSQSGNLDASDLFRLGLADVICADYHAPSLLPAAFRLADEMITDLPTAVRAITVNPARAVGLTDRGAIEPGLRADLNIVRLGATGVPHVETTLRGGQPVFSFAQAAADLSPIVA